MEVFAELGQIGAGINQTPGEVTGMAGGETDPFNSLNVMNVIKQVGECVLAPSFGSNARQIAAISINVLAQQGDFPVPLRGQTFHFQPDRIR